MFSVSQVIVTNKLLPSRSTKWQIPASSVWTQMILHNIKESLTIPTQTKVDHHSNRIMLLMGISSSLTITHFISNLMSILHQRHSKISCKHSKHLFHILKIATMYNLKCKLPMIWPLNSCSAMILLWIMHKQ